MSASIPPAFARRSPSTSRPWRSIPTFVQAWARVSMANSAFYYCGVPSAALVERARQAAEKAVALAPKRPEGYQALGDYQRMVRADFPRALEEYAKGQKLGVANVDLLVGAALAERSLGRWDETLDLLKQAARLDPRSAMPLRRLGDTLVHNASLS